MTRNPTLHQALAILGTITPDTLRNEIHQGLPGHPKGTSYDTDRTSSGQGPADPTANAATTPNRNAHDLAHYETAIVRIYTAALTLAALQDHYCPSHEPRRNTMQADTRSCHLHDRASATTQHHHGKHRTDLGSYLDTPLKDPVHVCAACYEHTRRIGRLPTTDELVRHDRTGKWSARTTGKRATVYSARDIADEWGGAA